MKHFCIMTSYWILAVLVVSLMLMGLDYSFGDALFLGILLVPGCLASRWLIPKVKSDKKHIRVINTLCVIAGIMFTDILLVIWYHLFKVNNTMWQASENLSPMLLNPVFLGLIMAVFAYCDYLLSDFISNKYKDEDRDITFTSDYRKVTLKVAEIAYIESRDTEVWIHAADGRSFRNKTPITQWQNILENGFIRIHRSYLVNGSFITSYDNESVTVNEKKLPISRKNREEVIRIIVREIGLQDQ